MGKKGYKALDLKTHQVIISRDINFHETHFPFHYISSLQHSPALLYFFPTPSYIVIYMKKYSRRCQKAFLTQINKFVFCTILYGLKQALRQWFHKLTSALRFFGFKQSKNDYSLFLKKASDHITIVVFYVDDLLVTGLDSTTIDHLKQFLA